MDEIKASPRKEWLYSLAQKLRDAPTKLGSAAPLLGALAESGKEYLTEPIARGLEHFAYGDRFGGPTNTPFIGSREEDMIAASPVAAITGAIGPASKAALYAGALRPKLLMSHSTDPDSFLKGGDIPKELTAMSMGIRNDKLMEDFGPITLIPRRGKFDPKNSYSTLHSFDSYTPRHQNFLGMRADELFDELAGASPADYQRMLNDAAALRLTDRMVPSFRKGGLGVETSNDAQQSIARWLPQYGKGGYRDQFGDRINYEIGDPTSLKVRQLAYGGRFPSFKAYEKMPGGAARLDLPGHYTDSYTNLGDWVAKNSKSAAHYGIKRDDFDDIGESMGARVMLRDAITGSKHFDKQAIEEARQIAKMLRSNKVDYGELKVWGNTQINPENFAGMMVNKNRTEAKHLNPLYKAAKRRGIPYVEYEDFDFEGPTVAHAMQDFAEGTRPSRITSKNTYMPREPKPVTVKEGLGGLTEQEVKDLIW